MLSKESKIRVLENFYALDYVFFGKPVSEVEMCCPLVKEEYLSIKGALMAVYVEMMKLVDHKPAKISEAVGTKGLKKMARVSATIARENSEKIVSSQKARNNIKSMLKEELQKDPKVNVSALVEKAIRSKAFGLAIDNLLIARSLKESKGYKKLNEWEGQIIEDSYKILRDNLVEAAYMILYDTTDTESVQESALAGGLLGALAGLVIPFPLGPIGTTITGALIGDWVKKNKDKLKNYCSNKFATGSPEYSKCMAAGKKVLSKKMADAKAKIEARKKSAKK